MPPIARPSFPDPAVSAAALTALRSTPAGLLADLDGTLAPIVDDPAAARLAPGAADALSALAERIAVVGLLTGRSALDARRISGLPGLLVVGNHGLEWLAAGEDEPRPDPRLAGAAQALERVLGAVPRLQGVTAEHKGLSATVHYRQAADRRATRAAILAALRRALASETRLPLTLREGRMSVELRPAEAGDKGTAVRAVAERHRLAGLVVLGDDVTDLDAFRAAADLRRRAGLRAFIGAVRGGDEVPPTISSAADAIIGSPAEAVVLLSELVARL